jgi:hypothetical protein
MKCFARIGLILLLFLSGAAAQAQTREDFHDIGEGFQAARAVNPDGRKVILVTFPKEYLVSDESYKEGSFKALVLLFGCEFFVDCKPTVSGTGKTTDNYPFVIVNTVGELKVRLLLFKLSDEKPEEAVGLVIMAEKLESDSPKVIGN